MADDAIRIDTRIDTSSAEKDLEKLRSRLSSTAKEAQSGFSGADTAIKGMDTSTKGLTMSMSSLSKVIGSISIVAVLTKVAQGVKNVMATTEEAYASIRKASTMFGEVAVDEEAFVNRLSQIASETGADITALGEAAYQAMSAGIAPTRDMADVLAVVEKSARLASGGFTDTETAISSSLSVLNAYKMGVDQLDKVQGILLQTQNKGVTTVGQLGSALSKVTPTAAAFGLSFEEVATSIALMTKQGTNTDVATTALSSALSELGKSGTTASKNLEAAAQSAGLTGTSFSELIADGMNLSEILTLMSTYAEENGLSLVDMFGSIEAGRAALQLAGDNADEYNDILASMGDTAGLVGDAFEKTVTPAERLSSSFNNLLISIGEKMKPTIDGLLDSLADMFTKMTSNETAGGKMKTSFESLKTALDEYKKAEEQARIETDALNNSILSIAKTNLNRALNEASSSYSKNKKDLDGYRESLDKTNDAISANQRNLDYYAKKTKYTTSEIQQMTAEERALAFAFEGGEYFLNAFNVQNGQLLTNMEKRLKLTADMTEAEQAEADMVEVLAMLYAEDAESANFLLTAYPELTKAVKERSKAYIGQKEAIDNLVEANDKLASNDPTPVVAANTKSFQKDVDSLFSKYSKLAEASDVLGDSYYSQEQYLKDLEDMYARGLVEGIDASSDSMEKLADEIGKVKEAVENAEKSTFSFTGTMKNLGQDIAKGMLTSVSALFDEIFNKESKLKELTAELDELSLTEKENLDAVATAEADLADARARMNEKDIESAERKLDIAKSQLASTKAIISSVKDEKNAVENGSAGWKAYANTAMQALGSVLEALGHQLAAQAVLNIIEAPWASAGYAAGSVAAYAAASWAKAQKFAQGGIVGGSSYSGDNMLARVNSGELILNMAQQDNVAKALSTLAEMSGLTGSGGAGVSVYMAGSTIYGLDEPAVGKAIYDNIQQLHYEGVL